MRNAIAGLLLVFAGAGHATVPALSALEHHVQAYHEGARAALREGASCLEADRQRWLAGLRRACKDDACRGAAYLDRLAELHALQPGVTAIRHFPLPQRPALVWIVPPAADRVAARPDAKAAPARIEGSILDEVATGDGYVVRTSAGERYLLVPLMFLEGATAQRLSLMASEPGARFVVRGHVASGKDRTRAFDPARCTFLYRAS